MSNALKTRVTTVLANYFGVRSIEKDRQDDANIVTVCDAPRHRAEFVIDCPRGSVRVWYDYEDALRVDRRAKICEFPPSWISSTDKELIDEVFSRFQTTILRGDVETEEEDGYLRKALHYSL